MALAASEGPRIAVAPGVGAHDANPDELALARWAVGRYAAAHLRLPPMDLYFHDDPSGCHGRNGYFVTGRVDLCLGGFLNLSARHTVLHEMAHGWSEVALTGTARARFLAARGLSTWNDLGVDWPQRGWEQAADIVAWGIGDGVLRPTIPDNDPLALAEAYRLLTGRAAPAA
jgi:hypothetical protein